MSTLSIPFLNTLDPAFRVDSEEVRRARESSWYARTPFGYAVLRYRQVAALLRDTRLHQGTVASLELRGVKDGPLHAWWKDIVLNADGEHHARLRRLVAKAFTPPAVQTLRPYMRATANALVDRFGSSGACEFMEAFAEPYPLAVICELLEIPQARRASLSGWANDLGFLFTINVLPMRERIENALAALYRCADEVIAARRAAPGNDLVSTLIAAEEDGDRLREDELRAMLVTLIFAGNDTTRNQLGLALATFAQHPEQWKRLADEPALAPGAVEEIMRASPAIPTVPRIAVADFEFEGLNLPRGTFVSLMLGVANGDPEAFGEARFDIAADRPEHQLTFGGGIHRCVGMWLARAEMEEALPLLARRLPGLVADGTPTWRPGIGVFGPMTLPLRFVREVATG